MGEVVHARGLFFATFALAGDGFGCQRRAVTFPDHPSVHLFAELLLDGFDGILTGQIVQLKRINLQIVEFERWPRF